MILKYVKRVDKVVKYMGKCDLTKNIIKLYF